MFEIKEHVSYTAEHTMYLQKLPAQSFADLLLAQAVVNGVFEGVDVLVEVIGFEQIKGKEIKHVRVKVSFTDMENFRKYEPFMNKIMSQYSWNGIISDWR